MKNNFQGITNLFIYYEQFRGDGSENKKKEKTHLNQKYSQSLQKKKTESTLTLWFPGLVIVAVSATITNIDRNCCRNGNKYGFISSFY